ncbi:MAG: peptidoglycan DD-metalloendopeptidase family protein [Candidatus Krumholzibacteria bacterium]|nr:peptidoglycan DD-metalloendopeptidase family protein [Candidatus Krumholzibacteria bacterium]
MRPDYSRIAAAVIAVAIIGLLIGLAARHGAPPPGGTLATAEISPPPPADPISSPPPEPTPDVIGAVRKNESFYDIMIAAGATPLQVAEIARAVKPAYDFRRIRPGQQYEIYRARDGAIERIRFSIDQSRYVEVAVADSAIAAERREYPSRTELREASGIIASSLYASISSQGIAEELGNRLVDIFAWDIDFFTEIRKGDFWRVIYEERTVLDGPARDRGPQVGAIVAAEFNTSGRSRLAFRFENEQGIPDYFDESGKSLRKQLLRAPLEYARISSSYSRKRYHPILHKYAPHLGIDYAAPTGTPVMSTGDGTVIAASRTAANGNYVKIRHANDYISYYLHLSRFGAGIRAGTKVRQGQTIGYVGATGYATGPHLDYRVKKGGRFVNPRSLELPPAKPVSPERMADFMAVCETMQLAMQRIPVRDPHGEYYAGAGTGPAGIPSEPGRAEPPMLR